MVVKPCGGATGFGAAEIKMAATIRRGHGAGHAQRSDGVAKVKALNCEQPLKSLIETSTSMSSFS